MSLFLDCTSEPLEMADNQANKDQPAEQFLYQLDEAVVLQLFNVYFRTTQDGPLHALFRLNLTPVQRMLWNQDPYKGVTLEQEYPGVQPLTVLKTADHYDIPALKEENIRQSDQIPQQFKEELISL